MTAFETLHRSPDQGNRLDEDEIRRIVEFYETVVTDRTHGPQLEGIESTSLEKALKEDPDVILIEVDSSRAAEKMKWPLLVPIEHHIDYSQRFFADHYPDQPAYILSLPPYDSLDEIAAHIKTFAPIAEHLKAENAVIAYDYLEGGGNDQLIESFLTELLSDTAELEDITPESSMGGRTYGLPKVVHFEGFVEPVNLPREPVATIQEAFRKMENEGSLEHMPQEDAVCLTPDKLRQNNGELLQQIWDIYSEQFDLLTEDHPSLQKQPREELERMLLDDGAVNIACMDEGKVASLMYLVHDIKSCVWLNKKFYDERYPAEKGWLAYYPGIVVAKEKAHQGMGYVQKMMSCLADAVETTGKSMIMTCQCTNVSMTYIPKMAGNFISSHPKFRMILDENGEAFTPVAEYNYKVVQVK